MTEFAGFLGAIARVPEWREAGINSVQDSLVCAYCGRDKDDYKCYSRHQFAGDAGDWAASELRRLYALERELAMSTTRVIRVVCRCCRLTRLTEDYGGYDDDE